MKNLTVRNIPTAVVDALEKERQRTGRSLNQTVIQLLQQGLGVASEQRSNGLGSFAGTWSQQEFREFEQAVAVFEQVDDELWR